MSLASMPDAQYPVKSNCARARQQRRLKVQLVDLGLAALSRGDRATVQAITRLIRKGGMRYA